MAYDEVLAERIAERLADEPDLTEKRMFGGLALLLGGHMAVAATEDGLLLRIDPARGAVTIRGGTRPEAGLAAGSFVDAPRRRGMTGGRRVAVGRCADRGDPARRSNARSRCSRTSTAYAAALPNRSASALGGRAVQLTPESAVWLSRRSAEVGDQAEMITGPHPVAGLLVDQLASVDRQRRQPGAPDAHENMVDLTVRPDPAAGRRAADWPGGGPTGLTGIATSQARTYDTLLPCRDCRPVKNRRLAASGSASRSPPSTTGRSSGPASSASRRATSSA